MGCEEKRCISEVRSSQQTRSESEGQAQHQSRSPSEDGSRREEAVGEGEEVGRKIRLLLRPVSPAKVSGCHEQIKERHDPIEFDEEKPVHFVRVNPGT
jgi:hypothetical protein